METNLRPLTLGEILDRTAQLYRSNFLLFAGIAAVYAGALLVLSLLQIGLEELLQAAHMARQLAWLTLGISGLSLLLAFIFAGAAVAANNRAVGWIHLGQPATIRGAYAGILPRLGRYLWLMTITAVVVWLPIVLLYAVYFGTVLHFNSNQSKGVAGNQSMLIFGIATAIFFLLLIPAVVYTVLMGLRYALAVPACVMENLKARQAIRRSIELSKGSRGRIFLLALLVMAIEIGLLLVTQAGFFVVGFKNHGVLSVGVRALQQVVAFCTNTFVAPIYATGLTLFYYDQRMRKEGYDIERMMEAAGMAAPPPGDGQALTGSASAGAGGLSQAGAE
ncbi:MAG: glycerophosphoryl diester phosphodiesterase membrane domain-containing protein [Acidobacteriota bacterium]|nr:glycerophosphoryl diester phosphodiesterase membrane domain-containing protein [Acidobacteriota bacterium]